MVRRAKSLAFTFFIHFFFVCVWRREEQERGLSVARVCVTHPRRADSAVGRTAAEAETEMVVANMVS